MFFLYYGAIPQIAPLFGAIPQIAPLFGAIPQIAPKTNTTR
jgi:hypothetical protein